MQAILASCRRGVGGNAEWGFNAADLRSIERDTAIKLLPRLKSI